jgi:hypothetical protein
MTKKVLLIETKQCDDIYIYSTKLFTLRKKRED